MTRHTQTILFHTLPIAFWLLAGCVCFAAWFFIPALHGASGVEFFLPAFLTLLGVMNMRRVRRHTTSVEECFQSSVLISVAAFWLPSVVGVIPALWIYLMIRRLFSFRSFLSSLIGIAVVAIWIAALSFIGIIEMPSFAGRAGVGFWLWIPTGSLLFAYIGSTIVRQNLRVR